MHSSSQWVVGSLHLSVGESLEHVDKRYGDVYKCADQHNKRHLVRVLSIDPSDDSLMKYYNVELDMKHHLSDSQYILLIREVRENKAPNGNYQSLFLTDYCENTLKGIISHQVANSSALTEDQILQVVQNIALGLKDLHTLSPPILHRNLSPEVIFIGGDGCFKIGYFGSCYLCASEQLAKDEVGVFDRDLNNFTKPELRPPELNDLGKGAIVTPKADVWQLGMLLDSLISLGGTATSYSPQLLSLRAMMLRANPRERPTAADIIHYIMSKESLARSGVLPSDEADTAPTVHPVSGGKEQTRGFFSGVREKMVKYMNKTGTRGWVMSATENIDTEPKHKYVRKLITKAWEKPQKVIKFYEELRQRNLLQNTVIALKACITFQQYVYNGSKAAIRPQQNPELPLTLLLSLRSSWEKICMSHESNSDDCCRSEVLSTLIMKYAGFLIEKLKFLYTYQDLVDGSYAPMIQLLPDRSATAKSPLQYELIKSLAELWRNSTVMHTLLLEPPKTIWNVRLGAALAVAQEEYAIISLMAHIVKIFKALPYDEIEKEIPNGQYFVNSLIEEFSVNYARSTKYCNTLRLVPELFERSDIVPKLPIGLDTYLRNYKAEPGTRLEDIKDMFNSRNEIMGLRVPQCIRCPVAPPKERPEIEPYRNERVSAVPALKTSWDAMGPSQFARAEISPPPLQPTQYPYDSAPRNDSDADVEEPKYLMRKESKPQEVVSVVVRPAEKTSVPRVTTNVKRSVQKPAAAEEESKYRNPENDDIYSYFDFLPNVVQPSESKPRETPKLPPPPSSASKIQRSSAAVVQDQSEEAPAIDPLATVQHDPPEIRSEAVPNGVKSPSEAKPSAAQSIESVDLLGLDFSPRANVGPPPLIPAASKPLPPRAPMIITPNKKVYLNPPKETKKQPKSPAVPARVPVLVPSPAEKLDSVEAFAKGSDSLPPQSGAPDNSLVKHILAEGVGGDPGSFFIDMAEVKFAECIGEGTSALVYKGVYRGTDVAIKKLKSTQFAGDSNFVKELKREIKALTMLRHPNLVLFMGTGVMPEGNVCILTEFCEGGTLFQLLHAKKHIVLSWKQRAKMALDIAKGMGFLHSHKPPVIHRDLKSLNLLLAENVNGPTDHVHIKITDFGLARYQVAGQYMTGNAGTYHWMAPEVLMSRPYTIKADVYSFGIVLWEIISRNMPYMKMTGFEVMYRVLNYNERPDLRVVPSDCPFQLKNMMLACWDKDPDKRPSFESIIPLLSSLAST